MITWERRHHQQMAWIWVSITPAKNSEARAPAIWAANGMPCQKRPRRLEIDLSPPNEAEKKIEADLAAMRTVRQHLDAFAPDLVVIFGDDQYENFIEDIVPPFCIYIVDQMASRPFDVA